MNEIEKMYMRCRIKKQQTCSHSDTCYDGSLDDCEGCNAYQYPPFTAEKQLSLIKWLARKDYRNYAEKLLISINEGYTYMSVGITTDFGSECLYEEKTFNSELFEEALAGIINNLWQDLTEEEKEQIRDILAR